MKVSQKVAVDLEKNGHPFMFLIPNGCSWEDALKAAADVLSAVNQLAEKAQNEAKELQNEEPASKEAAE